MFTVRQEPRPWNFKNDGRTTVHHPQGRFRTADAEQLSAAVLTHIGIARAPKYLFADAIESGGVQVVLDQFDQGALTVSAVHPAGRRLPARTRAFIDFFAGRFTGNPAFVA